MLQENRILRFFQWRTVQFAVVLAGFIGLVVAATPFGLSAAIKAWLLERGARQVVVGDVTVDFMSARFAIRGVHVESDVTSDIDVIEGALSLRALLSGRVEFEGLRIRNANLTVSQLSEGAPWRIAGLLFDGASAPEAASGKVSQTPAIVGLLALRIDDSHARLVLPRGTLDIAIRSAQFDSLLPWIGQGPSSFDLSATAHGATISMKGNARPFARVPSFSAEVAVENLPAAKLGQMADVGAFAPQGALALNGKLVASGGDGSLQVRWDGTIKGTALSMRLPGLSAPLRAESVAWTGRLATAKGGTATGRFAARAIAFTPAGGPPVTAATAKFDDLRYEVPGALSLAAFGVERLALGSPAAPAMSIVRLQGESLAFSQTQGLRIDRLTAEGLRAGFRRAHDGLTGPQDLFGTAPAAGASMAVGTTSGAADGLRWRIGRVDFGSGGILDFTDKTVDPPFLLRWRLGEAHVAGIDSAHPDAAIDIALKGKVGEYSPVEATGQIWPFRAPLALKATVKAGRLDLPLFTPYLTRHAGYVFNSGEGNLNAQIALDKAHLDARAVIDLRAMEVAPINARAATDAAAILAMPVDAALSLLRDRNKDIRLDIPVTGDPSAPQFDFSKVIAKATSGAIKLAGLGFLKYALQPFGAALMAGEMAQELAASIRLDPVIFDAGTARVGPSHAAYLARVAETMTARPDVRIKMCGRAIAGDRAALSARRKVAVTAIKDADLFVLARQRADALKAELVRGHGIDPKRVIACQAEIDAAPDAAPRVEFLI